MSFNVKFLVKLFSYKNYFFTNVFFNYFYLYKVNVKIKKYKIKIPFQLTFNFGLGRIKVIVSELSISLYNWYCFQKK